MFAKIALVSCMVVAALARPDAPSPFSGYQQPQPPQQSYSQPQQSFRPQPAPQQSYSAPQPQQSYSAPQPQPSYSAPQPTYQQAEHEHEEGMPFNFAYEVKDEYSGNDFSHNSDSNGDVVQGEYRVLLPDGRTQVVKYIADWKDGYKAEVTYEGEAQPYNPPPKYEEPTPSYSKPQPSYQPPQQPQQTYQQPQQPQQTYQQPQQPQQTYQQPQQPQQTYQQPQQPQQTYQQPKRPQQTYGAPF